MDNRQGNCALHKALTPHSVAGVPANFHSDWTSTIIHNLGRNCPACTWTPSSCGRRITNEGPWLKNLLHAASFNGERSTWAQTSSAIGSNSTTSTSSLACLGVGYRLENEWQMRQMLYTCGIWKNFNSLMIINVARVHVSTSSEAQQTNLEALEILDRSLWSVCPPVPKTASKTWDIEIVTCYVLYLPIEPSTVATTIQPSIKQDQATTHLKPSKTHKVSPGNWKSLCLNWIL